MSNAIRKRLEKLEGARRAPPADPEDESWLARFEQWTEEGHFLPEPDFPAALESFRLAVREAKMRPDPPYWPPGDFHPELTGQARVRQWRTDDRFPQLCAAYMTLVAMLQRLSERRLRELADTAPCGTLRERP